MTPLAHLSTRQCAMLQEMGVRVWRSASHASASPTKPALTTSPPRAVKTPVTEAPPSLHSPSLPEAVQHISALTPPASGDWAQLAHTVANCRACPNCSQRQHPTLCLPASAGASRTAHWMVVGGAPSPEEDRLGQALVGDNGLLLSQILSAFDLQRVNPADAATDSPPERSAYVTHLIKCRSQGAPTADNLRQCAAFLLQEIALVRPRVLIAVDSLAHAVLCQVSDSPPLGRLRQRPHRFAGIPVIASYPLDSLRHSPADKAKAFADWCMAAELAASPQHPSSP